MIQTSLIYSLVNVHAKGTQVLEIFSFQKCNQYNFTGGKWRCFYHFKKNGSKGFKKSVVSNGYSDGKCYKTSLRTQPVKTNLEKFSMDIS